MDQVLHGSTTQNTLEGLLARQIYFRKFAYYAVPVIVKTAHLDIHSRPSVDQFRKVIAIVKCHERTSVAHRISVIFRLAGMLDRTIRSIERTALTVGLALVGGNGEEISAARFQGPDNLLCHLLRHIHMLHDIKCYHEIERRITKRLRFQIFVSEALDRRAQAFSRKVL